MILKRLAWTFNLAPRDQDKQPMHKPGNRQTPQDPAPQCSGGCPTCGAPPIAPSQTPWTCGRGARSCCSCCGRGLREGAWAAMTQMRKAEGYIWVPGSEAAQSRRKPFFHLVTAENKALRMFLVACTQYLGKSRIQQISHLPTDDHKVNSKIFLQALGSVRIGGCRAPIGESVTLQKNQRDRSCLRKNRTKKVSQGNRRAEDTGCRSCTQPHACQDSFIQELPRP